jgi:hypothetical protein
VSLEKIEIAGSAIDTLASPPQWTHEFSGKREDGFLATSVAFSITPPFQTLPRLSERTIAYVTFSIRPDAPIGTRFGIRFADTPGELGMPPIRNEVSRRGIPQPRYFCGLSVEVVSGEDLFLRGDANRDRVLNLGDAVLILRHLFAVGTVPLVLLCPDAADIDDDGRIGITDAVALLGYLFSRGQPPAPPFPEVGHDSPAADDLGCPGLQ